MELWGTFSVTDHRRRRAFVADVLLYDRLAVPIPDGADEWNRWERSGRDPERQQALLDILGQRAVPVPWSLEFHEEWKRRYQGLGGRSNLARDLAFDAENLRQAKAHTDDPDALAQSVTRMVLAAGQDWKRNAEQLAGLPPVQVEAVPAYGSLAQLERNEQYRLCPADTPGGRPVLMFEWSYLVPSDSRLDDEALLKLAVDLAEEDETQRYRKAFHDWRRDCLLSGTTRAAALEQLEQCAREFRELTRRAKLRTRAKYALGVFAAAAGLGAAVFPALGLGAAAVGIGAAAAGLGSAVLKDKDPVIGRRLEAGAFIYEAQRRLRG